MLKSLSFGLTNILGETEFNGVLSHFQFEVAGVFSISGEVYLKGRTGKKQKRISGKKNTIKVENLPKPS